MLYATRHTVFKLEPMITQVDLLLLEDVVVEVVVAGHGHQRAEADPDRVKDLSRRINPYLNTHTLHNVLM